MKQINFTTAVKQLFTGIFFISLSISPGIFAQGKERPFYPIQSYRPEIPTPEKVLGVPVGKRPLHHREILQYFKTLAEASPNTQLV
ncbi:MAG: hypothetical protein ACE5GL_05565, partial [Calditrichia bacterium]